MARKSKKTLAEEAKALAEKALEVLTPQEVVEDIEKTIETVEKAEVVEEKETIEETIEVEEKTETKTRLSLAEMRKLGLL